MNGIEGVQDLRLSGTRAVFALEDGANLDEDALADAFDERGMQLELVDRIEAPVAQGVVTIDTGVT